MSHVLSLIYSLCDCDAIYLVRDVNSRLGTLTDYIDGIDDISERAVLDNIKNKHGEVYQDFLIEAKMCVLNGKTDKTIR